jgi:hypothetical protein
MEQHLPGGFVNAVVRVGDTVRRLPPANAAVVHDLTAGTPLAGAAETVCHNDLSPRNTVYRDTGAPTAVRAAHTWVTTHRVTLEAALV